MEKGLGVLIAAANDPSRPPQAAPGQRSASVSAISAISA
jgi:hypothetical protein